MIKSLSPYYVTIPFVSPLSGLTCTSYTLQVFVWNGAKNAPPTLPVYEFTKSNPTLSTENDEINIANLISDFINFSPKEGIGTELIDGENQSWIKWQTFYTTSNPLDATTPSNINTQLMVKGYSYGLDGKNASTPTNKILLSGTEFKVSRTGFFVLPIKIEETEVTPPTFTLNTITLDDGFIYDFAYTKSFTETNYLFYKLSTDTDYLPLDIISDSAGVVKADLFDIGEGTFDFVLRSYNIETNTTIETNSEQITITYPNVILNSVTNIGGTNYEYNYTISEVADNASLAYKQSSDSIYILAGSGTTTSGVNVSTVSIPLTGSVDFRVTVIFGEYITNSNVITLTI